MISIVMPTHESVPLMHVTLTSVFSQSLNDFEFIVVDASKDSYFEEEFKRLVDTYPILRRYASRFEKMKIIKPKQPKRPICSDTSIALLSHLFSKPFLHLIAKIILGIIITTIKNKPNILIHSINVPTYSSL